MQLPREIEELRVMATVYRRRSLFQSAEELDRIIVTFLQDHGGSAAELAVAYADLADDLFGQNRLEEAQSAYHEAAQSAALERFEFNTASEYDADDQIA